MTDKQHLRSTDSPEIFKSKSSGKSEIKILQVISRLCIGGTSVAVILATESLQNKGYSVQLLTGCVTGDETSIGEFALCHGVEPVSIRSLSRAISPLNDLKSLWQMIRLFRHEHPTIVHTHTAKAGFLGRIAGRIAGVPICIHTFHGHVFRGHFSPAKARVYLAIEKLLARWSDCLVAVSKSQGDELVETYQVAPASKFVTIPVAFDSSRYVNVNGYRYSVRTKIDCPMGSPLIGWVGRLTAVKDPELFLNAAAVVLEKYPNARFAIVGDGELRKHLERLLKMRKMCRVIRSIGWQSDLADFYADIDVLVMTSKHEGTPLTLLEAMASGKPFVSTNVGGIKDLMTGIPECTDGIEIFKNGILAGPSATSVATGITYLLDHPERALEMGRAGRAHVSEAFADERSGEELENLYLRLLTQTRIVQTSPRSSAPPSDATRYEPR